MRRVVYDRWKRSSNPVKPGNTEGRVRGRWKRSEMRIATTRICYLGLVSDAAAADARSERRLLWIPVGRCEGRLFMLVLREMKRRQRKKNADKKKRRRWRNRRRGGQRRRGPRGRRRKGEGKRIITRGKAGRRSERRWRRKRRRRRRRRRSRRRRRTGWVNGSPVLGFNLDRCFYEGFTALAVAFFSQAGDSLLPFVRCIRNSTLNRPSWTGRWLN